MASALQNGAHRRINKISRAVMAALREPSVTPKATKRKSRAKKAAVQEAAVQEAMEEALSNPRFAHSANAFGDDARIASAIAAALGRVDDAGGSVSKAFPRGDASEWYAHITSGEQADRTGEKKLRGYIKRQVAVALGMPAKKAGQGKASQLRASKKYEIVERELSEKQKKYFSPKSKVRRVPRKTKGQRIEAWLGAAPKSEAAKARYRELYNETDFARYGQSRMDWRDQSESFPFRYVDGKRVPKARANPRERDRYDWEAPIGRGVSTVHTRGPYKTSGALLTGHRQGLPGAGSFSFPQAPDGLRQGDAAAAKKQARAALRRAKKLVDSGLNKSDALTQAWAEVKAGKVKGASKKERKAQKQLEALAAQGVTNPFVGDLALENPDFGGVMDYLTGYAAPVAVAGGVAGGVHAFAHARGLTEKLASTVGKIPVIGEFASATLPYTLQGLLIGGGLALLAPMVGGSAGKYLALTGGAALVVGGGIDAFNYMQPSDEEVDSDLVSEIPEEGDPTAGLAFGALAFGDLALENVSALGDVGGLALTNGRFGTASISQPGSDEISGMYEQASYADAFYSGADFSGEEGQALLNGASAWRGRFGQPTHRMAARTAGGPSHLAGQEGHRWGWLIRTVGAEKARQICALPPAQRLKVLYKLRKAAISTYEALMAEAKASVAAASAQAQSNPQSSAGTGAMGASGASNYLGDPALFMGA